jgi:acyl-CoA thioesterase I
MKLLTRLRYFMLLTVSLLPLLSQANEPILLILGDSLSSAHNISIQSSWISLLKVKLHKENSVIKIINISESGDTTQNGISKLPNALKTYQPKWVLIELGGNDSLRGLKLSKTKQNLNTLIKMSQSSGAKVMLMNMTLPPNYGAAYIKAFEAIYLQLAAERNIPLAPFLLEKVALHPQLMQQDGIHPTEEAQPIILETVWSAIQKDKFLD